MDGEWIGLDSTIDVINPATVALVGCMPRLGAKETREVILADESAWPAWRARAAKKLAQILKR